MTAAERVDWVLVTPTSTLIASLGHDDVLKVPISESIGMHLLKAMP